MPILLLLAWRNLWLHKLRTILTLVSIMLGVSVILAVNTANRSTLNAVEAIFDEAAGRASLTVESAVSARRARFGFSPDVVAHVQALPGVVQVVPRVTAQTVYQGRKGPIPLEVQGIEPDVDAQVRTFSIVSGTFLSSTTRGNPVILVDDLAQRENLRVGRDIELLAPDGPETFSVVGIIASKGAGQANGGQVAFVPVRVAQSIFQRGRKIDVIDVVVEPDLASSPASLPQLKEQMQAALGETVTVGYPAAKGLQVAEALSSVQYGLTLFGLFALFASALMIHSTFTMELAERLREIGTLRTLGTSRRQIIAQLSGTSLLLGLIGSGLGLGLGFLLAVPLVQIFASITGYPVSSLSPSLEDSAASLALGLGATLLSTLWPAVHACRLSPLEAVRARGQEREGTLLHWSWVLGLALLAFWVSSFFLPWLPSNLMFLALFGGATFLLPAFVRLLGRGLRGPVAVLYGYEGRLGATNMERSRWRISTTVAVLMVGLAMGISVGAISDSLTTSVRDWMERALRADLLVSFATPLNTTWTRRLAAIGDVAVVSPTSMLEAQMQDPAKAGVRFSARVQAVDPATQAQRGAQVYASGQGDPEELWSAFAQGGRVLISTQIADEHHLHQGELLRVYTVHGLQAFPIAAVIVDFSSMRGTVLMTWEDARRYFDLNSADGYLLKLRPGADANRVRQQIEKQYGRSAALSIQSNAEAIQSTTENIDTAMMAFNVLVLIAFLIAAFSMVNTLTMNVIERTRELGLLRAVGMTRLQIGKMILAEALALSVISVLFGILFGSVFSRVAVWFMNTSLGFGVGYAVPLLPLFFSCLLALVISQLATLPPVRRVFGLTIVQALHYE